MSCNKTKIRGICVHTLETRYKNVYGAVHWTTIGSSEESNPDQMSLYDLECVIFRYSGNKFYGDVHIVMHVPPRSLAFETKKSKPVYMMRKKKCR